ncbi:MAG: hypothetical protein ACRCTD_05020 [Beijerinckiaceae bacterium]
MKKPVSLAPAGRSLADTPARAPVPTFTGAAALAAPVPSAKTPFVAEPAANDLPLIQAITQAAAVSSASIDAPQAEVAAEFSTAVMDMWTNQSQAMIAHSIRMAQVQSLSEAITVQGHFIREQMEAARSQAATFTSLLNQTMGITLTDRLPAMKIWAPWQSTICKPGG